MPANLKSLATFLNTVLPGEIPKGKRAHTWHKYGREKVAELKAKGKNWRGESFFHTDFDSIFRTAEKYPGDHFICISLTNKDYGPHQRIKADEAAGLIALCVDIDIKHENPAVHKQENLPETTREALDLCTLADFAKPTIVVHTGHGIQPWWAFKEPFIFENEKDRERGGWLAKQAYYLIQSRAAEMGWAIDATHDLARLYRLPGTENHKDPQAIREVFIMA